MERTVSHFNEEVDGILDSIKSRTQNQHYKLATLRGDDPIKNALDQDLDNQVSSDKGDTVISEESEKPEDTKKSRFSFLKRKKKK